MMEKAYKIYYKDSANKYKKQEIAESSPGRCVLHVYDAAIQSCYKEESGRAGKALVALMDALNFETEKEISGRLFRLYDYCLKQVHKQEFETPQKILKELRHTWQIVLSQQSAA